MRETAALQVRQEDRRQRCRAARADVKARLRDAEWERTSALESLEDAAAAWVLSEADEAAVERVEARIARAERDARRYGAALRAIDAELDPMRLGSMRLG